MGGFSAGGPTRGRLVSATGSGGGPTLFPELSERRMKINKRIGEVHSRIKCFPHAYPSHKPHTGNTHATAASTPE